MNKNCATETPVWPEVTSARCDEAPERVTLSTGAADMTVAAADTARAQLLQPWRQPYTPWRSCYDHGGTDMTAEQRSQLQNWYQLRRSCGGRMSISIVSPAITAYGLSTKRGVTAALHSGPAAYGVALRTFTAGASATGSIR